MRPVIEEGEEVLSCIKTDTVIDSFMTKDQIKVYLQQGVDEMIKAGTMPAGAVVSDIRIREVEFLVKRPDGLVREIRAKLVPEDEMMRRLNEHEMPRARQ